MAQKFLRFKVAENDPVYQAVVNEALQLLTSVGSFSKHEVLTNANAIAHSDLKWEFIVRMVEAHGCELVPVTKAFFKVRKTPKEKLPGSQIAGGNGRACHGYAIICDDINDIVVTLLQWKRSKKNGVDGSLLKTAKEAINKGIEDRVRITAGPTEQVELDPESAPKELPVPKETA